jgi:allantoin racemase
MKIRVVVPIISEIFNEEVLEETSQFKAPDTNIDVVNIQKGPASIESRYDDVLATYHILEEVIQAEKDGCDGVFIDCFGDPGVEASRELVKIPVVGGFQPAALTASLIAGKWSVVTVLTNVVPMVQDLARKMGIESNMASVRHINTPVLELQDKSVMQTRLLGRMESAVDQDGAEAIVLGCTGMLGLSQYLAEKMAAGGRPVPVVDPTAAAIGYLELLVRSGLSQSPLTYRKPPEKERRLS